jgi:DNA-binding transcriptional ArsR family regulator
MITSTLAQEITHLHANLCSALADPTRLLLLYALSDQPRNVTELTQELDTPQPTVSRHLKVLRESGLVTATRQGSSVQYELADRRVIEALDLLRGVLRDRIQRSADLFEELIPS